MMTTSERVYIIQNAIVGIGNKTLKNELVDEVNEELRTNINAPAVGLQAYGISKVAMTAAQISACIALGIEPEIIRYSKTVAPEVINKAYEKLADLDLVPTEV